MWTVTDRRWCFSPKWSMRGWNAAFRGRLRTSRYSVGRRFAPWHAPDFDRLGVHPSALVEKGEKVIRCRKRHLPQKERERENGKQVGFKRLKLRANQSNYGLRTAFIRRRQQNSSFLLSFVIQIKRTVADTFSRNEKWWKSLFYDSTFSPRCIQIGILGSDVDAVLTCSLGSDDGSSRRPIKKENVAFSSYGSLFFIRFPVRE